MHRTLLAAIAVAAGTAGAAHAGPVSLPVPDSAFQNCADRTVSSGVRLHNCDLIIEASEATDNDIAVALNNRGTAYEEMGKYELAMADFDRATKLRSYYATAYINRGFLDFIIGQFGKAASDLGQGLDINSSSAYAALWRHIALGHANRTDADDLETRGAKLGASDWPGPLVELYLGYASLDRVRAAAAAAKPAERTERACELAFYVGEYELLRGDAAKAQAELGQAAELCPTNYIEYYGARAELQRIGGKVPAPAAPAGEMKLDGVKAVKASAEVR